MYDCISEMYGSDHRPVILSLVLKSKRTEDKDDREEEKDHTDNKIGEIGTRLRSYMNYDPYARYMNINIS